MNEKQRLIELIRQRAFRVSDREEFVLSSGKRSPYYFDLKKVSYSPEGQYLIGKLLYERIKELGLKSRYAGGLTLGADPLATAIARYSYDMSDPVEAFVIRKEPKGHGTARQIEGNVREGESVIILEDVVTTGGSTIKAIEAARKAGLRVEAVVALLDRKEGGSQNIEKQGVPFYSILSIEDILTEDRTLKKPGLS